jgi:opacity protein-like surface antigen
MQKWLGIFAAIVFLAAPAMAQDTTKAQTPAKETSSKKKAKEAPPRPTPKYELEFGYTWRSYYPPSAPRFSTNGWNATGDYNWKNLIGFVGDLTGTYRDQGTLGFTQIYTLMGGPRVYPLKHRHKLVPYGQFLIGVGYDRQSIPANAGFSPKVNGSTAYVWAGGGGVDVRLTQRWAIRAIEFDYEKTHFSDFLEIVPSPSESNRRISVGFVYHWGEKK